ncbi:10733_t:CDS:2, partial [Racocetra fulgida]
INYVAASWDKVKELMMENCWMKTGILPLASNDNVELAQNTCLELIEYEENSDDSDKELPKITATEGISGLKSFILFAKQQMCDDFFFNNNDLKVFCKYLSLMKRKITESMNQKPITDFFKTADQSMSINDNNFFNETGFFDDSNVFPNNNNFFGVNNFSDSNDFSGDNFSGDDDFFDDNNLSYYYRFSDNYDSSDDY